MVSHSNTKKNVVIIVVVVTIIASIAFLYPIIYKGPVKIGYSGQLTGYQAEMGIQERNGAVLAVEEINEAGGVAGRPLVLLVRDDLGTPEGAQSADSDLIAKGVVAIIGHPTSGQTIEGLKVTKPAGILMISPTASTLELSGKDDLFFRLIPTSSERADAFARHIYERRNLTRLAIIYDTDNTAYSLPYRDALATKFCAIGGDITGEINFSSSRQPDFSPMIPRLRDTGADGLFIIANDYDTALIAQHARIQGWDVPLFTSGWAQTETLLASGGNAVEGMEIEQAFQMDSQDPDFILFENNYRERFGRGPSFPAVFSYEAVKVLATALEKTNGETTGLTEALLDTQEFAGIIDSFSFDKYGDVIRPYYMSSIHNGEYKNFEIIQPE